MFKYNWMFIYCQLLKYSGFKWNAVLVNLSAFARIRDNLHVIQGYDTLQSTVRCQLIS